jgi:CheY-like chemotaxis protein
MDAQTRDHCLDPFFTTKGPRGSGLGLAMVHGTVQRNGGTLRIESEPGTGTTVSLTLPVSEGPAQVPHVVEPLAPGAPLRILYVDDQPQVASLVGKVLELSGHEIELADGGLRGIEVFWDRFHGDRPFDVVITDLGMPGYDGRQLSARIKQLSPATPVVLLSGWAAMIEDREQDEVLRTVDAVLAKPPDFAELSRTLAKLSKN